MIRLAALVPLVLAQPALAAERTWGIGSFDRLRVDGPIEVRVETGTSPRATATAADARTLERIRLAMESGTLSVRMSTTASSASGAPVVVTLSAPALAGVSVIAGSRVTVAKVKGTRVDLTLTGGGALTVADADADQVTATLIGTGAISVAGRTQRARLATNGSGAIDASGLSAGDLFVSLDGAGETRAAARYTAQVVSTGAGRVTVTGNAKCNVRAAAGGVTCGAGK